jgi:hypothetical protein
MTSTDSQLFPADRPSVLQRIADLPADLLRRERRLALFGGALLAAFVPLAITALVDDRTLRGVDIWFKPMKFALSIALLSLTTAWFAGHLPKPIRSGRMMNWIVWLVIGTGTFELGYISLQAGLGQASHYNVSDALHTTMYALMGIAALTLTATQPMLAWLLRAHPDPALPAAYRRAILLGLTLTFVCGAGIGLLLSTMQPPSGGATVPLFGWSLRGGDLRPAHFVGIHAEQALPMFGLAVSALAPRRATALVWAATIGYVALFAALAAWGLAGRG